jgi:hypothetical protein
MTKRSYNQKSLVLISNHDFPAIQLRLLQIVTDLGLISDPSRLEVACAEISTWGPPSVGHHDLPFLGSVLSLEM